MSDALEYPTDADVATERKFWFSDRLALQFHSRTVVRFVRGLYARLDSAQEQQRALRIEIEDPKEPTNG